MPQNPDIENDMINKQPETAEKRCPLCYQFENGRCHQYDKPVKPGMVCSMFIRAKEWV